LHRFANDLESRISSLGEMAGKQAKVLSGSDVEDLLFFASTTRYPDRNRAIVLLSVKAGFRAAEIANLTWLMILDPTGRVGFHIELHDCAAKKGSGRVVPLNAELREAMLALRDFGFSEGPVIRSERDTKMTPLSIVVWFNRAYKAIGLVGCSSHSGRRTFITRAARSVR
jgi:integrase/recombinase XerD